MKLSDIKWQRSGTGRSATVLGAGDLTFDLYQDRASVPIIQVCEFPCIDAQGDARALTYWLNGDESVARFLADKCSGELHKEAA